MAFSTAPSFRKSSPSGVESALCGVSTTCLQAEDRRVGRQRLLREDVQAGPGQVAGVQRRDQRRLVHQRAAPGVDQQRARLHHAKLARADHAAALIGQRQVEADHVRALEQVVQLDELDAHAGPPARASG